jgi:hypothetical protein
VRERGRGGEGGGEGGRRGRTRIRETDGRKYDRLTKGVPHEKFIVTGTL